MNGRSRINNTSNFNFDFAVERIGQRRGTTRAFHGLGVKAGVHSLEKTKSRPQRGYFPLFFFYPERKR